MMTVYCIKTNNGCYLAGKKGNSFRYPSYETAAFRNYYYDDQLPQETFDPDWFWIPSFPKKIQAKVKGKRVNIRYELKDATFESEKLPLVILDKDVATYDDDIIDAMYSYKYDMEDDYFVEVDIQLEVLCEIDNFQLPEKFSFDAIHRKKFSDETYTITNANVEHQVLDKIIYPSLMLHACPCKLSSKQVYDITRQHVLEHIDSAVARVTSNYDFCFEVKKRIPLYAPEKVTYTNIFARTKKEREKIHSYIKEFKEESIFEMTHDQENYKNYTAIPAIEASNEKELKEKVDFWLESLMAKINTPLCCCPECKGAGYLEASKEASASKETEE